MTISPLFRIDHATLRIDGATAERTVRAVLADVPFDTILGEKFSEKLGNKMGKTFAAVGKMLSDGASRTFGAFGETVGKKVGKAAGETLGGMAGEILPNTLYLDFGEGNLSLSWGLRGVLGTKSLVRVNEVVIDGSAITFPLQPISSAALDAVLAKLPDDKPFLKVVRTGNQAIKIVLTPLQDYVDITVESVALKPGAMVITIGPQA